MTRESPSEYASLAQLTGQLDVFQVGGVEGHSTPPKNTRQARLGDSPGKCRKLARRKGFEPLTPRFEVSGSENSPDTRPFPEMPIWLENRAFLAHPAASRFLEVPFQ